MQTYELLQKAYGEECVSRATTFLWFGKFRDDREDVHYNERAGCPRTSQTDDNIAAVRTALQHDRRSTVRLLEEQLHINQEMIRHIITEDLGEKICARFMSHALMAEQKGDHMVCEDLLAAHHRNPALLTTIVTGDELWRFAYDPTTKRQSAKWTSQGSPRPQKLRWQKLCMKTMLIVFFDSRGMIHIEFVPLGQTVNTDFCKRVLDQLLKQITRVCWICTHPRPGACCTIMRPRITPSSFGSF